MDVLTIYITIVLFGIIFLIIFKGFSVIAKVKNQTRQTLKELEYQIKSRALAKVMEIGLMASKNIYKNTGPVWKTIVKNNPFKFWKPVQPKAKTKTKIVKDEPTVKTKRESKKSSTKVAK